LTQRDEGHPGYYRGRFLKLDQRDIITGVAENYLNESGFVCVLKFVKCSNKRQYQFRSEKGFRTKQEAKESAAKLALLSLELETRGDTGSPPLAQSKPSAAANPVQKKASPAKQSPPERRVQPSSSAGGTGATVASTPQTKDPKSRLKEYCDKNKLPQPVYEAMECGDASHRQKVTVQGKTHRGELCTTKKEAEKSAAVKALRGLNMN
jgi:hypothetical protein